MQIGIIGAGRIGRTLSTALTAAGHDVTFGVRDLTKEVDVEGATVADIGSAIEQSEVVIIAVLGLAVPEVTAAHAKAFDGKIVLDASNRFDGGPFNNFAAFDAVNARYVRAFNILGREVLENPVIDGVIADQYFSAADPEARSIATTLIRDVGLRPVHVGDNETLDILDGVVKLVIALAYKQDWGRVIAFRTLGGSND